LVIASVAAVVTGALMGLVGQGWAGTFAYMLGVHAGVRFPPRTAVRVVALCVVVGVLLSIGAGEADTPVWTNLLVVAALVPGMTRRTRQLTLAAANEVVEQTRRAGESEAASRALAERAAIARDIHDVLAHSLSGVNMQLSLADALFDAGEEERAREAVRIARHEVVTGLAEARAAVQTLRGDTIDPVEALQRLATGANETVDIAGTPYAVPGRVAHTLVRTAQEALTNARRHAPGAPVGLVLAYEPELVRLDVRNAAGSTSTGEGSGLGLLGMRERAAQLDARVEAGPLPASDPELPGGWRVVLEIPSAAEDAP
jgi:signal transduction histidine kinase